MDAGTSTVTVASALTDVATVFTTGVNTVMGNPISAVFVGCSLLGAGFALFRKARHR